jgi:glutaconate CoA-transferase subunit B
VKEEAGAAGDYTAGELMVACAAREIRDGEVVFVGMRLPLLAFVLAKRTHAPHAIGLFENGIVRDQPAAALLYTMSDGGNIAGALWCTRMTDVMAMLHQGVVDVGFIGGAQMDRFGNLNTSYIYGVSGDQRPGAGAAQRREGASPDAVHLGSQSDPGSAAEGRGPRQQAGWGPPYGNRGSRAFATKLPGSGGAADIAALAGRLLIIMDHERRRFVPRVDYVTSPGYGEGGDWRNRVGLPRGGPAAAITTMGVLRFRPDTREAYLDSSHPGTSGRRSARTGWDLLVGGRGRRPPTAGSADHPGVRSRGSGHADNLLPSLELAETG